MITRLRVKGFKSLDDFKLSFKPGLNVLIGPNGAGKTNICQALGLIASVADDSVDDYILSIGGVNSIFNSQHTKKKIDIIIEGRVSEKKGRSCIILKYRYRIQLYYCSEESKILKNESFWLYRRKDDNNYTFLVYSSLRKDIKDMRLKYLNNVDLIGPTSGLFRKLVRKQKNKLEKSTVKIQFNIGKSIFNYLQNYFYYAFMAQMDIINLKAFNIDPFVAKKPSDLLEPNIMLSDGGRLSNALFRLEERKKVDILKESFSSVLSNIKNIKTETSEIEFKRTFFIIDDKNRSFYAKCLSDGTIKVIALLVGMLSKKRSTIIIEEPENYLHPWASSSLIELFRDHYKNDICILTSHSETLLNNIKPNELIICINQNGKTTSRRIANPKTINVIIKKTGFGCGYHYVAGSFGGYQNA